MTGIEVRDLSFEVERGAGGLWNPRRPELSHMLNAFQLALPYLEPYFIDAIRNGAAQIKDPVHRANARAFCAQEANHARQHARYCRVLRERYPLLEEHEKAIQQSLVHSRQNDPLDWRLAYTAGYEAITVQMARWALRSADDWFGPEDQPFAELMMWHAAEEIEHRHVAFDVFQACSGNHRLRVKGFFAALRKTYAEITPAMTYMLQVDGYAGRFGSKVRRLKLRVRMLAELLPAILRYVSPAYHPSQDPEPPEAVAWHDRFARARAAS